MDRGSARTLSEGAQLEDAAALTIGPYRVVRKLGQGGMGLVYEARHVETGTRAAVKVVRVVDTSLLASFRREVFALRSIEHPGVVRIMDDGLHDGMPWYAMELLTGDTLADFLDIVHLRSCESSEVLRDSATEPALDRARIGHQDTLAPTLCAEDLGPPPPRRRDEALDQVRALCAPLAYVHGAGLVHRDLKPENIMLVAGASPVLLDFGLAYRFAGLEPGRDVVDIAGHILGTPPYMAPEQIRGDPVDARADLYALGCILYECLTGTVPFVGATRDVLTQHLTKRPLPPSTLAAGIPAPLDDLVMRLLEKRARDRLGFAAVVAEALADLGGRPLVLDSAPVPRPYLYRPALAGRSAVLSQLSDRLFSAAEGRPMVLIGGQSGVGKTRLAMELGTRAARRNLHVVAGRCMDALTTSEARSVRGAPLHPLRPLLLAIADHCRVHGREVTDRILGARGPVLAPYEPALRDLPGQSDRPRPAELPAEAARFRLLEALAETLRQYGRAQPTMLILDDLQWADEVTLALLDYVAGEAGRIAIACTYRSEERVPAIMSLAARKEIFDVELGALDRDAVASITADMLALARPPSALVDFLVSESEGNAFFIAEYLRTAVGEGVLIRGPRGAWEIAERGSSAEALREALPIPGGLRDLVRRRVAPLSDAAHRLVEVAAVLGRDVDARLLTTAADSSEEDSRRALEQLRTRQVLEETEEGGLRFVHDKFREIVYADIDPSRLPRLHDAAARAIEALVDDRRQLYPSLAHHHAQARNFKETLDYLEKAGEQALESAAWGDARRFFEHALSLADQHAELAIDEATIAHWNRRLGEAHYNAGDLSGARTHLERALDGLGMRGLQSTLLALVGQLKRMAGVEAPVSSRPAERARHREAALATERLCQVHYFSNAQNRSLGMAFSCAQHAERLGPSPELARAYATLSAAASYVPLPPLVERYGRRAEAIARLVDDAHALAWVGFMRGLTATRSGHHRDARRHLQEALEVATASGDVRHAQEIQTLLAQALSIGGERELALEHARAIMDGALRTRNQQAELWASNAISKNLVDLGRPREALVAHDAFAPLAETSADESTRMSIAYVALAHAQLESWDEAVRVADDLLATRATPRSWHACLGYVAAADIYLSMWSRHRGDARAGWADKARRATKILRRAARIFRSHRALVLLYSAMAHALEGHTDAARRDATAALHIATRLALPAERARAHYELARLLPTGDTRRASHARRAQELFAQVGATHWHARATAM